MLLTDLLWGTMTGDLKFGNGFHSECVVLLFSIPLYRVRYANWKQRHGDNIPED